MAKVSDIDKKRNRDFTEKCITDLFSTIVGVFPSTRSILKTKADLDHTKSIWFYGLFEAGIIDHHYELNFELFYRGEDSLYFLKQRFMPSCGQFIHLCLYGLEKDEPDDTTMQDDTV